MAIIFIIVGIFGLFLPLIQGVVTIIAGLFLLTLVSPKFDESVRRKLRFLPTLQDKFDKIEKAFKKLFRL